VFTTIVAGANGHEGGRDALRLAATLAGAGTAIVAVRVCPFQPQPSRFGPVVPTVMIEEAQAALDRELADQGVAVARTRVVADASPARALRNAAEAERADLIVVGSTHHGAVGRVLAGDVAAGTLHGSRCAVAVAPRGYAAADHGPLRRIGVGFDGSEQSREALALAAALARPSGAAVRASCVVVPAPRPATEAALSDAWLAVERDEADANLRQALGAVAGIDAVGETTVGDPLAELVRLSRDVDLLVIGSHGRGRVRRLLLGSTAAALAREAHCPVLVVPRAGAGPAGTREPDGVHTESAA
jgi:nucleotide-binding universal stress UspA family protein